MEMHTGILPLIIVAGLAIGLVVLFVKAISKRRWVLGTVGVLGGLCLLGSLMFVARSARYPVPVAVEIGGSESGRYSRLAPRVARAPRRPVAIFAERPQGAPQAPWRVEIDPKFKPDVYPSARSAARDLAAEVAESMPKILPGDEAPEVIQIFGRADPEVLHAAAEALVRRMPTTKMLVEAVPLGSGAGAGRTDPKTVRVELDVPWRSSGHRNVGRYSLQESGGSLRMQAKGASGALTRSARFVEKLWVANFAEFVGRNPKSRWILAQSQQPCIDQHEAEQQALEDAAAKLLGEVSDRLGREGGRSWPASGLPVTSRHQDAIVAQLQGEGFVVDRFAQSFLRPYGRVWRQAVLIDASDDNIERLAVVCAGRIRALQASWARQAASIGGLLLVICLVYLFLNAVTKGYFSWPLRAAAVAVVIIGALVVVLFLA